MSKNLHRDPLALCTHMEPEFQNNKRDITYITGVHFLSDVLTTQYKNKKMLYVVATHIRIILGYIEFNGNIVKAVMERALHTASAFCREVGRYYRPSWTRCVFLYEQLISILTKLFTNIEITAINEQKILEFDKLVP